MKRVLALVAAVVLVAGAFVVRSRVIDSNDSSGDGVREKSTFTVGCTPELMPVCQAAASETVKVLPDAVDIDNAAAAASKIDAWLTYTTGPAIVNAGAPPSSGQVYEAGWPIGRGRFAILTTADRAAALRRSCGGTQLTWRCLVRSAGRSWSAVDPTSTQLLGTVKVGVGDPASGLGAMLTGPLALATAKGSDPGIDDIDAKAVARVVGSVDQLPVADEVDALTIQGPAAYGLVVAPEGLARRAAASTRGQGLGLTVIYPEPVAQTGVELASLPGGPRNPRIPEAFRTPQVRAALATAGWTPADGASTTGLPAPDVLFALRQELTP